MILNVKIELSVRTAFTPAHHLMVDWRSGSNTGPVHTQVGIIDEDAPISLR